MNPIVEYYKEISQISDEEWELLKHPQNRIIHDAFSFKDGKKFLKALHNQKNKNITIMPDYDADGVTSGIYAFYGLKLLNLGKEVNIYFPDSDDGFGMSPTSVRKAMAQFPNTNVFITTDNGISAIDGIKEARKLGVKTLVTDHHEGLEEEPDALAIVNPNRIGDTYPFKGLSGGHVIHKVLYTYMNTVYPEKKDAFDSLLPLVGISTVADLMPIREENHSIVKQSLEMLNRTDLTNYLTNIIGKYPELTNYAYGIMALLSALNENKKAYPPYTESTYGWVIGPILNAPRRLTNKPDEAFKLFLQDDWSKAYQQAQKLIDINEHRKGIVNNSIEELESTAQFKSFVKNPNANTFTTNVGHGIVGIIAGRLTNTYKVPTIVFSEPDEEGFIQGSGRSPEGIHILNMIDKIYTQNPSMFKSYGGHAGACGVTIKYADWEEFNQYFQQYGVKEVDNKPQQKIEALPTTFPDPYIKPLGMKPRTIEDTHDAKIYIEALEELDMVAPFGQGFPPLQGIITIDLNEINVQVMGAKKNHVKFKDTFSPFEVIVWSDAKRITEAKESRITILYKFDINEWAGRKSLQGIGKDYLLHD